CRPREAFVRLVAGLSQADEPVFTSDALLGDPCHSGMGKWLKSLMSRRMTKSASESKVPELEVQGFDFDQFLPGLSTEMAQVQSQALFGQSRPSESPLREEGLVPSSDGLLWVRPRKAKAAPTI